MLLLRRGVPGGGGGGGGGGGVGGGGGGGLVTTTGVDPGCIRAIIGCTAIDGAVAIDLGMQRPLMRAIQGATFDPSLLSSGNLGGAKRR
ncbi:unnamed protein product [Schistocephalus solidus]|uniref:Uncharacterized protein n=1 Tax=Schistocephalus solidus TaxID=70667 RepID=A0A183TE73_SCHSO|nr:unnamed protein product [Schistocephalus solidus]